MFAGDRVEWDGKARQLPVMKNIQVEEADAQPVRLTAAGEACLWEFRIFSRMVTESDVRRLDAQTRAPLKIRPKVMLVHLAGMDPNAKLLAKNLKFWVVSLHRLNILLDLHQLPKFVWVAEPPSAERVEPAQIPVRA
jgi:hypothetical protein